MEIECVTLLMTETGSGCWLECVCADHDEPRAPTGDWASVPGGTNAAAAAEPKRSPIPIEAWVRRQFGKDLPEFLALPPATLSARNGTRRRCPIFDRSAAGSLQASTRVEASELFTWSNPGEVGMRHRIEPVDGDSFMLVEQDCPDEEEGLTRIKIIGSIAFDGAVIVRRLPAQETNGINGRMIIGHGPPGA